MKIEDLRRIGQRLFLEIGKTRLMPFTSESLGRGAGGDKTFPIDKKAEDIIIGSLESLREPLTIISEEIGIKELYGGGKKILIDPIDGSKNAITGIPFYCSSIAVVDGDEIEDISLSYVVNLLTGDEFWAERDKGAFFLGKRIHCQRDENIYLVAYEAQDTKKDIPKMLRLFSEAWRTRCLGATALDLSYVAYGAISVFVSISPSRTFDFAGGWLLVKEAGGIFTDLKGNGIEKIEISLKNKTPVVVSGNKGLHEKALRLLNE